MNEIGSGLGLIITKQLIDMQSGNVWIESQVNKGTCFRFTLPQTN
jgi:signal transduction histidine kinase